MSKKLTIVGPEPERKPDGTGNKYSLNIEALLLMLKYDKSLKNKFLTDKEKTLSEVEINFTASEKFILQSLNEVTLNLTLKNFTVPLVKKNSLPSWKTAALVLALLVSINSFAYGQKDEEEAQMFGVKRGITPTPPEFVIQRDFNLKDYTVKIGESYYGYNTRKIMVEVPNIESFKRFYEGLFLFVQTDDNRTLIGYRLDEQYKQSYITKKKVEDEYKNVFHFYYTTQIEVPASTKTLTFYLHEYNTLKVATQDSLKLEFTPREKKTEKR